MAIPLLFLVTLFTSCKDEEFQSDPWLQMTPETGSFTIENERSQVRITINSNCKWTLQLEFDEPETPWATLYPNKGEDDGRFYLYLNPLNLPYQRTCYVVVSDISGKEIDRFAFTQTGTPAYITIDNSMPISSSSDGGQYSIPVSANVNWVATVVPANVGESVSWVRLTSATPTAQTIAIDANGGDVKRFAILRFSQIEDPTLFRDLEIVQLPVYSIDNAELITIKELLRDYSGVIEDNIKVEGFVISNKSTANIPEDELYIQDASGQGLVILFSNAEDNDYALNQKLTVWATGGALRSESKSLTSLASTNFSTVTTSLIGDKAPAVEMTDLTQIDLYPNTLVTFKNVSFVIPIGTVFNGSGAEDCNNTYMSTIRDRGGNTAVIRTLKAFTEKWSGGISASTYDITAIVLPDSGEMIPNYNSSPTRLKHERYSHTLRLRNYADLAETAVPNPYTPIAVWYSPGSTSAGTTLWTPQIGSGTFNITDGIPVAPTVSGNRYAYCLIDPSLGYSNANSYCGFGKYPWWDAGYGGNYWKFSVSTASCTGDIYVAFMLGSFGTAARYFQVQWSTNDTNWNDVPDSEVEIWNGMTTAVASAFDLNHLYTNQEFFVKIPSGSAGQENLYIRLITPSNTRTSPTSSTVTIATTSPSCILFVGVYENR